MENNKEIKNPENQQDDKIQIYENDDAYLLGEEISGSGEAMFKENLNNNLINNNQDELLNKFNTNSSREEIQEQNNENNNDNNINEINNSLRDIKTIIM